MPAAQPARRNQDEGNVDREALKSAIRTSVLRTLGEPAWVGRVQVRPLWGNYYRVNVLVGQGLGCERVVGSYFLEADGEGNILNSTPDVSRPSEAVVRPRTS